MKSVRVSWNIVLSLLILLGSTTRSVWAHDVQPDGPELLDEVNQRITNIDTDELLALIEREPSLVVVDVRNENEVSARGGMIAAGRELIIPRGWLEFRLPNFVPARDTAIVVYCGINQRSPLAADTLMKMGYTNVRNYADGFFAWRDRGLPVHYTDRAIDSHLYRRPEKVIDGVWSAIGATAPGTYENSGHNNNLSFVIGDDGVLVFNAGDNYLLARALHDEIKARTHLPVKYVVLENGQGHAMLGSSYWQEQGVPVIAHVDTANEISEHGHEVLERMLVRNGEKGKGTTLTAPDITFEDKHVVSLGSTRVELLNLGPAHSPGDIVAWLPAQKLVITGDVAFHQRLLPVFEHTDTAAWVETWAALEALGAVHVIPGHGDPTDMATVKRYTHGYLVYLRERIAEVLDDSGELKDAYDVDQTPYAHLDTFHELARLNAGRVFQAMEFE